MNVTSGGPGRRLPWQYLPAAYLESAPKLLGSVVAGAIYLFAPGVWPGAWAWIALGPLLAVLVCEPVWRWTFTRVTITPHHLRVATGAIHRREQSLAWPDIGAVDIRQSWAFARWRLHVITLSQAGDERSKAHLWAADEALCREVTDRAGHALGESTPVSSPTASPSGVLIYRAHMRELLLASVVYGQFALIGGGAAMGLSEALGMFGADEAIARWLPLPPAVWGVAIAGGIVVLGLVLTVVRYASFDVRRMPDGRLVISYGFLSTHTRSVTPDATIGIVLQRNLVEILLGRVRLSLLTTDSAAQLGTNLVLPSLPRRVVERLLRDAFGEHRAAALLPRGRGSRAAFVGLVVIAALGGVTYLACWWAAALGWPPLLVVASGAATLAMVWPLSRVLCSRLIVDAGADRVVLLTTHVVQRQTILSDAAVHIAATGRLLGHPLFAHVSFYAGMPRTFRALRFSADEVDALSAHIAHSVPLARTRRRTVAHAPARALT